ncbi:MAG: hypothetical protein Q9169_006256 [Polycauliona sp. 2 TL-2023]
MTNIPSEPEFEQAYKELASTLENSSLFQKNPEFKTALQVASIPERVVQFRVVWEDDKNQVQVNRGYRVQFNSALGPYKGGLRFHPTVNLSILKFLGFEQIFKNALTGLNIGGGKGGADFDPKGKSDNEIRKFCNAFMRELSKHIGADTDIPAGDIGVSPREIGWLFGAYKAQKGVWEGCLTGKGGTWGGSLIRPEATGYGLVYYVQHMIQYASGGKESFEGKRVAISGSGNVAQYAALKAIELGATILSLSDSKGTIVSTSDKGITPEEVEYIAQLKVDRKQLTVLTEEENYKNKFKYIEGARPWTQVGKVDVALPSATQNEVSGDEAKALIEAGAKFIAEGSNMGCSQEAIDIFEAHRKEKKGEAIWYAPGKAANAGGVAVSGLEMAQNSQRISWTSEEVDSKLKGIMESCFKNGLETAKEYVEPAEGEFPSLVAGSNIAGFSKVAEAMKAQGDWWAVRGVHRDLMRDMKGAIYGGIGKHTSELSPTEQIIHLKCYFAVFLTYGAAYASTKLSILLLYMRIFPVRGVRWACWVVGTLALADGLVIILFGFCQCRPFNFVWNRAIPGGHCLPFVPLYWGLGTPTVILSVAAAIIPIPVVWKLHMRWSHKFALFATFATAFVTLVLILTHDSIPSADDIAPIAILLVVEPCIAIIFICLPTIGPALQDIASYSTIEYKKFMCRIKMASEPERSPSVQRAEIYAPIDKSGTRIYEVAYGFSSDSEAQSVDEEDRPRELWQDSLEHMPEKPAMARGKWSSV